MKKTSERISIQDSDKVLSLFMEDLRKYPPLKESEIEALTIGIQKGDAKSREKLINHNIRFVIKVAKKYRHQGVPFSDLINAGILGLINSAEKYVYNKETKFISYAVHGIRHSIQKEIATMSRCFNIPANVPRLLKLLNDRVENGEILKSEDALLYLSMLPSSSLDGPTNNEEGGVPSDYLMNLVSKDTESIEDSLIASDFAAVLKKEMVRVLNAQEYIILTDYFGLSTGEHSTLESVGNEIGITKARVHIILVKALMKLKNIESIKDYNKN